MCKNKNLTDFSRTIRLVKRIVAGKTSDKNFVEKIANFLKQYCPLKDINPSLKSDRFTEAQREFLKIAFLKVVLDIDVLRSLCLFPPEGIQFERWNCLAGPCSSSDQLRCINYRAVNHIREATGLKDNLPENYYDNYQKVWGTSNRQRVLNQTKGKLLSPLILFPVGALAQRQRDEIIQTFRLQNEVSIDSFFLCSDHFRPYARDAKTVLLPLPLRSSALFNYSIEYLKLMLEKGVIRLKLDRGGTWSSPHALALINANRQGPNFIRMDPVCFEAIEGSRHLRNVSMEMGFDHSLETIASRVTPSDQEFLNEIM